MRITTILAAGAVSLTLAGAAMAAPEGNRIRFDPTASVTRADTLAMAGKRFDRIDTNQDGMIDAAEMAAHREKMQEWRAKRMAARTAAKAEAEASATAGDAAAKTERRERWAKRAGERGSMGERGSWLNRLDTDGDGMISRDEFVAPALKRFDRADADGDGVVTPEERAAMREARRASRG
jgi:Ca2+-binding EF-hand superfamily protein